LMTCNTTDRMDPALLRKGRIDFTYEFVHKFV
jgi:ATP-dependent 26S proteasome regulatory subunit